MSKQDEYREAAVASLRLAGAASNQSERMRMLALAEAWFKLAERSARPQVVWWYHGKGHIRPYQTNNSQASGSVLDRQASLNTIASGGERIRTLRRRVSACSTAGRS
jgi:hypothetical protein